MIVVKLTGGLGNQMFQYAAGRALANRHQTQFLLDIRGFEKQSLREFALDRLSIHANVASENDMRQWPDWFRKPAAWLQKIGISTKRYKQPSFEFDPRWNVLTDNTLLEGYFQSERYFLEIKSILKQELFPKSKLENTNYAIEQAMYVSESVMIHIRRGDYVSNAKTLKTHGLCSLSYYEKAIEHIKSKIKNPKFFVFSDDPDWTRTHLGLGDQATYIVGNADAPEIDLCLMTRCKHFIVANSSFSWWGAWLGGDEQSIRIAPRPLFDKATFDEIDLIPNAWITLNKY